MSNTKPIPPGTYTRENLPEISEGAKKILERVRSQPKSAKSDATPKTSMQVRDSGTRLGLRLKDSGTPLGIKMKDLKF